MRSLLRKITICLAFVTTACGGRASQQVVQRADRTDVAKVTKGVDIAKVTQGGERKEPTPRDVDPEKQGPDGLVVKPNSAKPEKLPFIRILGESDSVNVRPRSLGTYILNGTELTETLKGIFGPTPRPSLSKSGVAGKMTAFFSPEEAIKIGAYVIYAQAPILNLAQDKMLKANQARVTQANNDYLGALRSFFGEACPVIISRETDAKQEANVFVSNAEAPSPKRVSDSMAAVFRFSPSPGQLHDGAQEYSGLMAQHLKVVPEDAKAAALKDEFVMLCVQIGLDPRFYAR